MSHLRPPTFRYLLPALLVALTGAAGATRAQTDGPFRLAEWEKAGFAAAVPAPTSTPSGFDDPDAIVIRPAAPVLAAPVVSAPVVSAPVVSAPVVAEPTPPISPPVSATAPTPATAEAAPTRLSGPPASEIAGALRQAMAGLRREDAAIAAFYAQRRHQPLFVAPEGLSAVGRTVQARLAAAGDDGLDPAAYRVPAPSQAEAGALAATEIALARSLVAYAGDASGGRTDPRRLSRDFDVKPERVSPEAALAAVAGAGDVRAAIEAFNPPHDGFRRLRAALQAHRASAVEMRDGAVQRRRAQLERDLVANLERWRWAPRDLGAQHVWVNIPRFDVDVVAEGRVVHQTRSIVGREETQTPVFSDRMNHIVFNPSWFVPASIIRREMVGPAARDPSYFTRRGLEVRYRGRLVDPAQIDWSRPNFSRLSVRQPPGERNALGKMKFMFPNRHAVYLHDTPTRALFSRERRAFSHGCIRVENPEKLAAILLSLGMPGDAWSRDRVDGLAGEREQAVRFRRPLPIHLVYFTLEADEGGALTEHEDIYGHNARVAAALDGRRS